MNGNVQSLDSMQIIQNLMVKQQKVEEKCQEMVERQIKLESLLAESKKENKELKEKGKDREERVQTNLEEANMVEFNIRTKATNGKEKRQMTEKQEMEEEGNNEKMESSQHTFMKNWNTEEDILKKRERLC
ncbi:hypothetical protein TIFTF001_031229 [Ficus carica]|uniref:Uncharacterized protein n=1 Tax=Ficus carica TaxID=3494 RepID=A0AA88J0Q2_FICCA|nr:hypothetical protein TIFTF001_031229 [Ficus carica]